MMNLSFLTLVVAPPAAAALLVEPPPPMTSLALLPCRPERCTSTCFFWWAPEGFASMVAELGSSELPISPASGSEDCELRTRFEG